MKTIDFGFGRVAHLQPLPNGDGTSVWPMTVLGHVSPAWRDSRPVLADRSPSSDQRSSRRETYSGRSAILGAGTACRVAYWPQTFR
jgi:hypothetical protein